MGVLKSKYIVVGPVFPFTVIVGTVASVIHACEAVFTVGLTLAFCRESSISSVPSDWSDLVSVSHCWNAIPFGKLVLIVPLVVLFAPVPMLFVPGSHVAVLWKSAEEPAPSNQ